MTITETKRWLRSAWYAEMEINILLRQHWEEHERMLSITAQLNGMPGTPSKDPHAKMDRHVILEDKVHEKVLQLRKTKNDIKEAILKVEDPLAREVLLLYYITDDGGRHKTFEQIAARLNYSEKQVQRLHKQGVEEVFRIKSCP